MKRTSIAPGVYKDPNGGFWVRPTVDGKRTWRKLKAQTERYALKEGMEKIVAQERAKLGAGRDPFSKGETFREMAELYLAAHCPNRKLEPRGDSFVKAERARLGRLTAFFGSDPLTTIKLVRLPDYKKWRVRRLTRAAGGERTVEMDLCTLSNVMNYAVATGVLDFNYIRSARPRFQTEDKIRHCREFAPESADELHQMAALFFEDPRSEVMGWLLLFTAMSGCRISEMIRLRTDARANDEPGHVEGDFLFIRRSKRGINPFIPISPEFRVMLNAFHRWHRMRYPGHAWYFPGRTKGQPLAEDSFSHAVPKCARALGLPHRKAHGLRSFYVTKRRSDGASDVQIAAEIGDKTASLISKTYGSVPPNWVRGLPLSFVPKKFEPAWSRWEFLSP